MRSVLNRPNVIARAVTGAVVVLIAVAIYVSLGSSPSYTLKLALADADGLRVGSQVLLGGVQVGTVKDLSVNPHNDVIAELKLDPENVHVGKGATAGIVAANLLGEEYVALKPGDPKHPLPSGATLAESATTAPTDLDQVVDVLNDPTRARLAILLDEAGTAVAGRQSSVSAILRQLPLSLTAATRLLDTMVQDNHTLTDVVATGNQFIAHLNTQSAGLKRVIDVANGATDTLALRAADLSKTIVEAPEALRHYTVFAVIAGKVAHGLALPARQIITAAPALSALLKQVKPFTAVAIPTLNRAASIAPTLTRLAVQATPTVKRAIPTLASLQNLAQLSAPFSAWAGLSSLDLLNIFGDWTQSIQFRDGVSHIFNGDVYLDPSIVLNLADQGASPLQKEKNLASIKSPSILQTLGLTAAAAKARAALAAAGTSSNSTSSAGAAGVVKKVLGSGTTTAPTTATPTTSTPAPTSSGSGSGGSVGSGLSGLLNGLLGGKHGGSSTGSGSTSSTGTTGGSGTTTSSSGSAAPTSGLSGLLGYLMGK
jgi:phospholipid/cholesterol/gamma-HCH transport system substrate-binding protein